MKKITAVFILMISFLFDSMSVSLADTCSKVVYIECQRNSSFYMSTTVLCNIEPVLDKRTFDMGKLTKEQRCQECQISPSVKATIYLGGDGGQILLNQKMVGAYTFEDPDLSKEIYITPEVKGARVSVTESRVKKEKEETTHFDKDKK